MGKRSRSQSQGQDPQELEPGEANPGEAPLAPEDAGAVQAAEAEAGDLEPQSFELPLDEYSSIGPAEQDADEALVAEAVVEEPVAIADESVLQLDAESGLASPELPDMDLLLADDGLPMDELLAELLAQDTNLPAVELETAGSELAAAEMEMLPDPEFLEQVVQEQEPVAVLMLESATARPRDREASVPASEAGVFELEAPEPELQAESGPGTETGSPQPEMGEDELLRQKVAEEADQEAAPKHSAQPAEPEPEPLAPQPPLETVVSSIDSALEAAGSIRARTEPAASSHHHKQFSQLDDYVVFSLSGSDYAVPVRDVAEIGRVPSITRVPNVPDFVRGITNLRGEVVPVLNLPTLLGMQEIPLTARGRVLFLQGRERGSATGLLVDEVRGIQRIQSQQLEQVTGLVDDKVTSVLRGVHGRGDRLLNVLDLEQLFQLPEFKQLETRV